MDAQGLAAVVVAATGLITVVTGYFLKRQEQGGRTDRDARRERDALLRWAHRVERLAAANGWDLPVRPDAEES